MSKDPIIWLTGIQAVYFTITGVWPLVHVDTFMRITGPKRDIWLVKTVGATITAIGLCLAVAAWTGGVNSAIFTLAVSSAAALGAVDLVYVLKKIIPPIYLLDAVAEATLILAWLVLWLGRAA